MRKLQWLHMQAQGNSAVDNYPGGVAHTERSRTQAHAQAAPSARACTSKAHSGSSNSGSSNSGSSNSCSSSSEGSTNTHARYTRTNAHVHTYAHTHAPAGLNAHQGWCGNG